LGEAVRRMRAAFPRYRVLAIHTTDDDRNPPETGVLQAVMHAC